MKNNLHFPEVTLLITHYNRSVSLEKLLRRFERIEIKFGEVIVSDDCSNKDHLYKLHALQEEFGFRLICAPCNKGLGNNLNKGQEAVQTGLVLYVQEDFEPAFAFRDALQEGVRFLEEDKELDMVRFFAYRQYPYTRPYKNGFSEIYVPPQGTNYKKIYAYSDHPHLRRATFPFRFGKYAEGIKSDRTEYRMCLSFIKNKGRAVIYNDYQGLFTHGNTENETSTVRRSRISEMNNPVISFVRNGYRQIRYNYDMWFKKQKIRKPEEEEKGTGAT